MVINLKKKKEEIKETIELDAWHISEVIPQKPKIEPIPLIEKTDSLNNDLRNLFNTHATKINEIIDSLK